MTGLRVLLVEDDELNQALVRAILARSQELQDANRALRAANEAKNEFLSRVSHELRTPLNAILGFGELLSLGDISPEHSDWVTMMLKAARHQSSARRSHRRRDPARHLARQLVDGSVCSTSAPPSSSTALARDIRGGNV